MSAPIKKNDRQTVYIEDLTHDGNGVAKIDGYPLFIQGALPGETAEIHVMKTLKNYGFAKVVNILEKSPDRVEAPCVYFSQCGGCQLQHLSYEGQLKWKQNMVANVMKRLGKIDAPVHPVKGMEEPWHYRNKSQIPFAQNESGQMVAGFYKTKSHSIVDMERCLIQTGEADVVMADLKRELEILGLRPYDEKSHQGMLRHVVVRKGRATGEVMVVLVTKSKKFPQASAVIEKIRALIPNVTSIVQNVNGEKTNVIFGNDTFTLWGKDTIEDTIGNVRFEISARSFYQVNPVQTEVLYKQADYAQLTGNERVIDAYCGIGSISLFLAQKAGHVMGVEIVEQAIEDAKRNAALNGFTNTYFEGGPAEEVIPRYKEGKEADVLVVDPPRKGCDEALLSTIIEQKPKRVVYVSCNPATLARDLRILEDGGYKTQEVQPVDMFPHTTHCEAVAWLELV